MSGLATSKPALSSDDSHPLLITPKLRPDLDGTACAIAYAEMLERRGLTALPFLPASPDPEACFVLRHLNRPFKYRPPPDIAWHFILVDASDLLGLPLEVSADRVVEVIDHRLAPDAAARFPRATLQIELVGAAATLIAERARELNVTLSPSSCILLASAIHSNTQNLRGSVTTPRDIEACAWATALAPLPYGLLEAQSRARTEAIRYDIAAAIRQETKVLSFSKGSYAFSQLELTSAGDLLGPLRGLVWETLRGLSTNAMLNIVDVSANRSSLLVSGSQLQDAVERALSVVLQEGVVAFSPIRLRKQIAADLAPKVPQI